MIKAVIFDLDDTLYSEKDYIRSGFNAIEKECGISAESLWKAFEQNKPAIDTVLADYGKEEQRDRCLAVYRRHKPSIKPYPGVTDLIDNLKQKGLFVGIVTDGRPEGQRNKIEALGLNVDKLIITDELGGPEFRKPCDIAFRIIQKVANIEFNQMIYVADNPLKDFIAPHQLGMKSIYFKNPNGLYSKGKEDSDLIINDLRELVNIF